MADLPELPTARRFTDREVALILKTAAELQEQDGPGAVSARGLSQAELEQFAEEAGIDRAVIRRAVAELDARPADRTHSRFLGGPTEIVVERTVDAAIAPEAFDTLLEVVRRRAGTLGEVSSVGRLFGWRGRLRGAKAEVSVTPGERQTAVRVRVELDEVAVGHFMLKGVLVGAGGGLVSLAVAMTALGPVGALVGASVAGGSYLWARRGYRGDVGAFRALARGVADDLAARMSEVARSATSALPSADRAGERRLEAGTE